MKTTRRQFVKTVGAGALGVGLAPRFGRAAAVSSGSGSRSTVRTESTARAARIRVATSEALEARDGLKAITSP